MRLIPFLLLVACGGLPDNTVIGEMTADEISDYCADSTVVEDPEEITCGDGFTVSYSGMTPTECEDGFSAMEGCTATLADFEACDAAQEADPCSAFEAVECAPIFACIFG